MTALLRAGSVPDVNQPVLTKNRESPLHIAAKHGHSGCSAALVNAGADVDCRDRNGWTPLHLASRFGQIEVRVSRQFTWIEEEEEEVHSSPRILCFASVSCCCCGVASCGCPEWAVVCYRGIVEYTSGVRSGHDTKTRVPTLSTYPCESRFDPGVGNSRQ